MAALFALKMTNRGCRLDGVVFEKSADLLGISNFVTANKRFLVYLERADIYELEKLF